MPSNHFTTLQKHIEELRQDLLPDPFDPTGLYDDDPTVRTRTAAFVAFVHAEFEVYFESRVVEIAVTARDSFESKAHTCRSVTCLLGFTPVAAKAPPSKLSADGQSADALGKWRDEIDIKARVQIASNRFIGYVRQENHGVKEKDLAAILIPIGFHYFNVDPLLVAAFNTLGSSRGNYVHNGKISHLATNLDPKSQYDDLKRLSDQTEAIDQELDALLAAATAP